MGLDEMTAAGKAAQRADEAIAKKDAAALNYVLADENGRWFIMRLFEQCHLINTTFPPDDHTNRMLINEGERRVGLNLLERVVADMGALDAKQIAECEYFKFMTEQNMLIEAAEER